MDDCSGMLGMQSELFSGFGKNGMPVYQGLFIVFLMHMGVF